MKNFFFEKKILVTGAAGFIGSHICDALVQEGAIVTAVVRNKSKTTNLAAVLDRIRIQEVDLTDKKQVMSLLRNQSIIIHAAAVDGGTTFKRKHADRIFHENVRITMNIFESLKKKPLEKVLFISSAEVYSHLKNKSNISEDDFALSAPVKAEQWYAFSKMIGEYTAQLIGTSLGIQVIIVRPANIYGPKDTVSKKRLVPILMQAVKKRKKKILLHGTGKDIRSFMHISDFVNNTLQILAKSTGGIYNIASSQAITIEDFTKIFSDISKTKIAFSDKSLDNIKKSNRFILNITKAQQIVTNWHDVPYKQKIKEMIEQL